MSAWPLLTAVLLGVNLGRLGRRGMWIGLCVLVATALALSWVARGQDYPTLIVALIAAATTITIWACVPRETAWHLVALGALAAAGALLCALLDVPEPAASRGWTWAVAALLLADPSTRLLRWGLEALGKPYGELAAHSGRGEAIGVVEAGGSVPSSIGRAIGALRPFGVVEVDDQRHPARSASGFIEDGAEVVVTGRESFGLVIQSRDDSDSA